MELYLGDSETIVATVEPAESTDKVTWVSSDEAVATVADGVITAVGAGEAIITAKAGNQKVECKVTVTAVSFTAVDMGLSVKWANMNLGASKPEEFGDYYAWGETDPKKEGVWSEYKFLVSGNSNDNYIFSKYNTQDSHGAVDNKTVLDLEDDVAHVTLGGNWRIPTAEEWTELRTNCARIWTMRNGVNGYKVTGPNGNSIFLSAAGFWDGSLNLVDVGSHGWYSSSSLGTDGPYNAWILMFDSDGEFGGNFPRYWGYSVRPVTK